MRSHAGLVLIALFLFVGSDLLLSRFPSRLRMTSDGQAATITMGGTTSNVSFARPVRAVRFSPPEGTRREYQIDGSDSTNNPAYDAEYFARFAASPYYRFQAWLRDEGSYSSWRDLVVRDREGRPFAQQARPALDEAIALPAGFDFAVDLYRVEVPRAIEFLDEAGGVVRIEINRNDKVVRVAQVSPNSAPVELAHWYFTREWLPALAGVLSLLMRACALALVLVALLVPIAAFLPGRLRVAPNRALRMLVPPLAAVVTLAASVYLSVAIFDREPWVLDALSYYFQAKVFANGMLAAPVPPLALAFDVPFTTFREGKWFSMYPPGTSLVLAVGFVARVPWLVEPVLAAASALLIYATAQRQFGTHTALLAVVLMASSPFLHLQAGTFMSHVPGMFWAAVLIYAVTRYVERRAWGWAVAAAFALGFLFLTREMSGILYALTVGGYAAWRYGSAWWRAPADRPRLVGAAAAAGICLSLFACGYLLYNRALTGSPWLLPRVLFSPVENSYGFGEGVGFYGRHTLGGGLVNADEMLTSLSFSLFGWPFAFSLALMALPFLLGRARTWDRVYGAVAVAFVLAYIGLYYHGIAFGPRYYFDALPAFVLLSARGFSVLAEKIAAICRDWGRERAWPRAQAAALLLCAALIACNVAYFWPQQTRLYGHLSSRPGSGGIVLGDFVQRGVSGREVRLPNAIVVVRDQSLMRIFGPLNCHRVDCDTIFIFSPDDAHDSEVRAAFPGRDLYRVIDRGGVLTIDPLGQVGAAPGR